MNLILFNMSNLQDWEEGVVNRNFFIMRELINSNKFDQVVLIDFLAIQSVKKIFGKQRTWKYYKCLKSQQRESLGKTFGISERNLKTLGIEKKVLHFSGLGVLQSASKTIEQLFEELGSRSINLDNSILWNYNPFLPQVHELPAVKTVFDTVDNWSDHASYKKESSLLRSNYQEIDKMADVIFTVSEGLLDLYKNERVYWIPNGVDIERFSNNEHAQKKNKKIIGYIGTIQERVDFDLVEFLCNKNPDKLFHFYGPVWGGVQDRVDQLMNRCENVTFFGRIPYNDTPSILSHIDVAIIPHKLDAFLSSTNPMKMYDYLAAGKPIVTTPGAGTEQFKDVLYIEDTFDGFNSALQSAMKANLPTDIQNRKDRVKLHTWKHRLAEMMDIIERYE